MSTDHATEPNTDSGTNSIAAIVDAHLAGYCEPDEAKRADLLATAWNPTGTLIDPPFDGSGIDGIAAMTDVLLTHYAGHTFERTTEIDVHHGFGRYGWSLVAPDGTPAVTGTDFLEVDADGQLVRIIGFFGDPTPAG